MGLSAEHIDLNSPKDAAKIFKGLMKNTSNLKFVRTGELIALGDIDAQHRDIAVTAKLKLIQKGTNLHASDAGRIAFEKTRLTVYDISGGIQGLSMENEPIKSPKSDEFANFDAYREAMVFFYKEFVAQRSTTCQLLIAVANVLPSHPEIFFSQYDDRNSARVYVSPKE